MIEHFLTYGDNLEDQSVASNASSAPLDHCGDYNDWLAAGCPDSDTEYVTHMLPQLELADPFIKMNSKRSHVSRLSHMNDIYGV